MDFDATILKTSIPGPCSDITPRKSLAFSWKNRVITGEIIGLCQPRFAYWERRKSGNALVTCTPRRKCSPTILIFPCACGSIRKYTSSNYSFKRKGATGNGQSAHLWSKLPKKSARIVEPVITDCGSDDQVSFIVFFFFHRGTNLIRERDAVMDRRMILDGVVVCC